MPYLLWQNGCRISFTDKLLAGNPQTGNANNFGPLRDGYNATQFLRDAVDLARGHPVHRRAAGVRAALGQLRGRKPRPAHARELARLQRENARLRDEFPRVRKVTAKPGPAPTVLGVRQPT